MPRTSKTFHGFDREVLAFVVETTRCLTTSLSSRRRYVCAGRASPPEPGIALLSVQELIIYCSCQRAWCSSTTCCSPCRTRLCPELQCSESHGLPAAQWCSYHPSASSIKLL